MAWLISKAMMQAYENSRSSPELVAEYSAANCLDGKQFAPSSMSHTPQAYLSPDKMTDFSRLSRFGMMFAPLTGDLGEDVLTWFLAGFPVRTSARQEKAKELPANEAGSGWKWRESSVKYDHDSRLWKTRQCSLLKDSEWFSETWPQWGLMRDGECWELPMSARPIFAKESGLWPTPTVNGNYNRKGLSPTSGDGLATAVWKTLEDIVGILNPTWVEWLMGWPLGWTDLKPLETAKSHSAPPKPGGS